MRTIIIEGREFQIPDDFENWNITLCYTFEVPDGIDFETESMFTIDFEEDFEEDPLHTCAECPVTTDACGLTGKNKHDSYMLYPERWMQEERWYEKEII